jgi:hypothetical protein
MPWHPSCSYLNLAYCLVLFERPASELLVGRDDVDSLVHPPQVVGGWDVRGRAVDDGGVGDVVVAEVLPKTLKVARLTLGKRRHTRGRMGTMKQVRERVKLEHRG